MGAKAPLAYSLDEAVKIQAPRFPPVGPIYGMVPPSSRLEDWRGVGVPGPGVPWENSSGLPHREGPEQQPINSPKASFFEVGFPKGQGRAGSVFRSLGTPTALQPLDHASAPRMR